MQELHLLSLRCMHMLSAYFFDLEMELNHPKWMQALYGKGFSPSCCRLLHKVCGCSFILGVAWNHVFSLYSVCPPSATYRWSWVQLHQARG
jgi:hypothetical protein